MRISSDFSTRIPGKWVLAGEHSVLRGASAIALPHPEFSLAFDFLRILAFILFLFGIRMIN